MHELQADYSELVIVQTSSCMGTGGQTKLDSLMSQNVTAARNPYPLSEPIGKLQWFVSGEQFLMLFLYMTYLSNTQRLDLDVVPIHLLW